MCYFCLLFFLLFSLLIKNRVLAGSESEYYNCLLLAWVCGGAHHAHYWAIMPIKGSPGYLENCQLRLSQNFWSNATGVKKGSGTHCWVFFSMSIWSGSYIRRELSSWDRWLVFGRWMWILIPWLLNGLESYFGAVLITTEKLAPGQAQRNTSIVKPNCSPSILWQYFV